MLRVFDADTLMVAVSPTAMLERCEQRLVTPGKDDASARARVDGMWLVVEAAMDGEKSMPRAVSATLGAAMVDAALATISSKHLAVAAPRSIGIIGGGPNASAVLAAHFAFYGDSLEVRLADDGAAVGLVLPKDVRPRAMPVHRVVACDIVCVLDERTLSRAWLCDGSHLNLLHPGAQIDDNRGLSWTGPCVASEASDGDEALALVSRGITAGRESGEITVYRPSTRERNLGRAALADLLANVPASLGTLFDVGGPH